MLRIACLLFTLNTSRTRGKVYAGGTPDAPPALPIMDEWQCSLSDAYPEINLPSLMELMSYTEKGIESAFAKRQQAAQTDSTFARDKTDSNEN